MEKILKTINFQKNKKFILIGFVFLIVLALGFSYCSRPVKNTAREDMPLNILAMGQLPELSQAMSANVALRSKVKDLISYDEAFLFVNYRHVNSLITETMFLWSGLTSGQIEKNDKQKLAAHFIRYVYGFPADEPIQGNPFLEDKPWADLFQKIKAKILMQGAGHKIYDGVAYYDSTRDKMVIEGGLSEPYVRNLNEFINTQPEEKQKGFRNNYLLFIDHTLGFENLNDSEKKILKELGFF